MFQEIQRLVEGEFSANRALALTAAIHKNDRWSTFSGYRRTGDLIATCMREYGLSRLETLEIPADGVTTIGDWTMPMAWDVRDACLEIVTPKAAARVLTDYREEPACLAMWSAPTPRDGQEAQVVLAPQDLSQDADVAGKVVFSSLHGGQVRKWAAARGAIGVISDYPACSDDALANGVCWVNAWVDHRGWGYLKSDTPLWGFSLDRERGAFLRRLLESGQEVRVRALVSSWLYEGSFLLPTGVIEGSSEEEIIVFAHAYEYGAEDNAAGCAVVLEAMRAIQTLVRQGILPRPKRDIRALFSWECYGSIPWCVDRISDQHRPVAGLVVDDVGGKTCLTGAKPTIVENGHCAASFADTAAALVGRAALSGPDLGEPLVRPWMGGTDHTIFQDPMFGVSTPWITETPARFHHTSLDGIGKIDVAGLGRAGVFAATYLYFLANAGAPEAVWLAERTAHTWSQRISCAQHACQERMATADNAEQLSTAEQAGRNRVEHLAAIGTKAVLSAERLLGSDGLPELIRAQSRTVSEAARTALCELEVQSRQVTSTHSWAQFAPPDGPPEIQSTGDACRVPRRLVPGLLTLCSLGKADRRELDRIRGDHDPMWSGVLTFALYWADGARTIAEIDRLVHLEMGDHDVDLVAYFCLLQKLGYVEWA